MTIKKPHTWLQIVRSPIWECFSLIVNIQDDISLRIVYYFFNPVKGKVIRGYAPLKGRYGVDLVCDVKVCIIFVTAKFILKYFCSWLDAAPR